MSGITPIIRTEIEAMKKLTWSLHSEDPEPSGKVKKDERPTETADSTAVATDVKRLETKVRYIGNTSAKTDRLIVMQHSND